MQHPEPVEALILALPQTAGSALYGMLDVLSATGSLWQELVGDQPGSSRIRPRIVADTCDPFECGNGIPVHPTVSFADAADPAIIIVPELWLAPDDDLRDRHDTAKEWLRTRFRAGATVYSACSGSVLLAAAGLLNGREATSHWGYADLFRKHYPEVDFRPEPNLVFSDPSGRIVTAGGATSWHDLVLHIVARHCSPGEALRIAKVYLLKWHGEGQLPYTGLVRRQPHADSVVRKLENWLADHSNEPQIVTRAVKEAGIPERTLKRRFKMATGSSLIDYTQNLRIESAKTALENSSVPIDDIAVNVGYENVAFFRRLFRRSTGMKPSDYRRMFQENFGKLT